MKQQEDNLAVKKNEEDGGDGEEGDQDENGVKNLRIDFLHSKMPQAYPLHALH